MANRTLSNIFYNRTASFPRWTPNTTDSSIRITADGSGNCSLTDAVLPRQDSWVIPLVVLSTLNIMAIVFFEVYVLYKSCGSRRHLFLGQMLLLGLFLCSALGFAFVPTPHWFTCALTRAGVGLAYVLVFATLLVKCVFLLSLHVGVYLSAAYQGLLLFFAMSVQVVIAIQWLVYRPPEVVIVVVDTPEVTSSGCYSTCATPPADMIVSLAYSMFLIVGVSVLAIRARTVQENHGEALYIGTAIGITIPIWVAWILVSMVTDPRHHDACVAFGVVVTSSVVFLVMFLPKGRQLASMGRDGIYTEDGFSSVNQSMYTPSFLHLKPPMLPLMKQGTLVKPLTSTFPPHPGPSRNFVTRKLHCHLLPTSPCIRPSLKSSSLWTYPESCNWPLRAERGFFMPAHPSRLWRYSHPATLQLPPPPPEDLYLASERYFFSPPGMKLYRSPLY